MLPFEIWEEISLSLPYNFLSINKTLIEIYNENWFKSKLNLKYPNLTVDDYQSFYKRSLRSGRILLYDGITKDIGIEGIGIYSNMGNQSILTFDGKLYSDNGQIGNDVITIARNTYIKKHEWYINSFYLITKSEDEFLFCSSVGDYYYFASASKRIYCFDTIKDKLTVNNFPNIVKMVNINGYVIFQSDDKLYVYVTGRDHRIEKIDIAPVEKLFTGCIKLKDGTIVKISLNYGTRSFEIKTINVPNNNLRGAMFYYDQLLVLLGNDVYKIKKNEPANLIYGNVKHIENGYLII